MTQQRATGRAQRGGTLVDARVVLLTHYIPLYQVRVLQSIAASVADFHVLLSTPIEPNRDFAPDWSGLDVAVQDNWTIRRRWRHRTAGFDDPLFVHIPYDTNRRLRALDPDVVMSHELGARSVAAAIHCRRRPKTKLVLCTYMSERTEQGRGWLRHQVRQRLLRAADAVTYNGPSCRRYLESLGVPETKLHHLPYAADDRTVYRGSLQRDDSSTRNRLLCVGQLTQRKGVLPLVDQVAQYCIARPQRLIHLTFAGDGPLRGEIESRQVPTNLKIQVLGNVSPTELANRMQQSGAVVAATLADEWLLVVNEALQAGLPVIGSIHAQAVSTLVQDAVNGWQYDPAASDSLMKAIDQYFAATVSEIAQMREQCRVSVAERTPQWAAAGAIDAIRAVLGHSDTTDANTDDDHRESVR